MKNSSRDSPEVDVVRLVLTAAAVTGLLIAGVAVEIGGPSESALVVTDTGVEQRSGTDVPAITISARRSASRPTPEISRNGNLF